MFRDIYLESIYMVFLLDFKLEIERLKHKIIYSDQPVHKTNKYG